MWLSSNKHVLLPYLQLLGRICYGEVTLPDFWEDWCKYFVDYLFPAFFLKAEVNASLTNEIVLKTHQCSFMCVCFPHQYELTFEWRWVVYLYSLDVRGRISVAEMLTIKATNCHVADTGFFGALNRVKFDSSSHCAGKIKTIPFSSSGIPKIPGQLNFL